MVAFEKNLKGYRVLRWGILMMTAVLILAAANPATADAKIGFVDFQKAIIETREFKKSQIKFRMEIQKEKGIIDARKKKVEDMVKELNKQSFVLNPELKKKKEESFLREKKAFERYVQDRDEEFKRKEKLALAKISKKMLAVLRQLGKQKKLTMVIEKQAVFYNDSALDLTSLATKTYDRLYPK